MYGCTRELEDSVTTTQHRTNSPGALNIKAGVRTREHDSRREHRMSREPPGYFFGMRALFPECSGGWPSLERRTVHFDFSYYRDELEFLFLRTRLYTVRSYYWSEQNETEKPSDEPPTDREHRPGARADQAHRPRGAPSATAGLSLVITFRFCCMFL